jgi:hypothetical protein
MKLPPKTLHNRNKDFDDVSDLTMNFHPKNFTSNNNNNGDDEASSEGYDEEARSEVMSDTSSIYSEGAGSNVGSGMGEKKRSKNKLSKYLKRAVGVKGSGSVTKQSRSGGGVKSDTAVVSNSGGSIASGGNTPQVNNNMRKTVADQMVANMFSNSSGKGIERAKSWKAETQQQQHRLSMSNNSEHSMEYSSLSNTKSESVTKLSALGYRSEAVGAAAMAVEFGYTPVAQSGVGRGEGGSGDGGVRRGSADSEPTPSISSPMKRGGGSGVMLNRRSTVAEGDCKFLFLVY